MAKQNNWKIATFVLIGVLVLGLITGFIVFKGEGTSNGTAYNSCVDLGGRCSAKGYAFEEMATGGNLGCPPDKYCFISNEKLCEATGGDWAVYPSVPNGCCCPDGCEGIRDLSLHPECLCCYID